ncbi:hypothetical protein TRVL_01888 [Trypanosoma vivax]|nr:hypothetical protein TRVL_01888 [Trypanosoma vivax]
MNTNSTRVPRTTVDNSTVDKKEIYDTGKRGGREFLAGAVQVFSNWKRASKHVFLDACTHSRQSRYCSFPLCSHQIALAGFSPLPVFAKCGCHSAHRRVHFCKCSSCSAGVLNKPQRETATTKIKIKGFHPHVHT